MDTPRPSTVPRLLSASDVAEWLGIPVASLYSQRYHGRAPGALGIRVGRHLRFRRVDVETWFETQAGVDSYARGAHGG
jgi:predicted DNA-binding transcriptional regulator AlpA